jgi:hypothetical protein
MNDNALFMYHVSGVGLFLLGMLTALFAPNFMQPGLASYFVFPGIWLFVGACFIEIKEARIE